MTSSDFRIGIGATDDLRLRVSVATLVRVLFKHPVNGEWMLALERKATLLKAETGAFVQLMCQPFGGAVRIQDLDGLQKEIGDFHFDSERSQAEQDFRIFIRPSGWPIVRDLCIDLFSRANHLIFETDPTRELAEEFADTLALDLNPDQYKIQPVETLVEDASAPTGNIQARGAVTRRVYRIFEARISDDLLAQTILSNSEGISDQSLCELAWEDTRRGSKGRANAVLTVPLSRLGEAYLALSPNERNTPISFDDHQLEETVAAILGVDVPKYRRIF